MRKIDLSEVDWELWFWVVIAIGLIAIVAFVAFSLARIAPVA